MGWPRRLEHELDGWADSVKAEAFLPHSKAARLPSLVKASRRRALHALMHFDLKGEAFVE